MKLSPTQAAIAEVFGKFLEDVLPAGVEIVQGQDNLVPAPKGGARGNYAVFTPLMRRRLATNQDTMNDCSFTGEIDGSILTVTDLLFGELTPGNTVWGANVVDGTTLVRKQPDGTWIVDEDQTVVAEPMAAGTFSAMQETEITFQVDLYGLDSADNAQIVSTLFRDDYAYLFFTRYPGALSAVTPLHADDPRQSPFVDDSDQYEKRWMVTALVQANQTVTAPQQFADQITPTLNRVA